MRNVGIFVDVRLDNLLKNSGVVDDLSRYNASSDSNLDRIYLTSIDTEWNLEEAYAVHFRDLQ